MSILVWLTLCLASAPTDAEQLDDQNIRDVVRDVLADPEFRRLRRQESRSNPSEDVPDWLRRFLEWLFNSDEDTDRLTSEPAIDLSTALYVLAILALVVIVTVLVISMRQRLGIAQSFDLPDISDDEALNPSAPPGDLPSDEYERRALAHAERGDFRSALRELVLGTMSWIERAELIRYRKGLTNRDYVRAVWRDLPRRESMLLIVESFEFVFYGRRVADALRFESSLAEFRQSFGREAAHARIAS